MNASEWTANKHRRRRFCGGAFSIRDLDLCSERGTSQHRAWYLEGSSKYFKNKLYCVLCIHYLIMIRK